MPRGVTKVLRTGSAPKRAAIMAAAWDLFVADGFERTSVDAVAARAGVSKRTVYDYFGDKSALLVAVVEAALAALIDEIRAAVTANLLDVDDLEGALLAFTRRVAATTLGSATYASLISVLAAEGAHLEAVRADWIENAPEEVIAERFAEFGRQGLLDVPDPRLAADHYVVLTFGLVLDRDRAPRGSEVEDRLFVEGVRAFLRAYATAPREDYPARGSARIGLGADAGLP